MRKFINIVENNSNNIIEDCYALLRPMLIDNSEFDHIFQYRIDNDIDPYEDAASEDDIPEDYIKGFWIDRIEETYHNITWLFKDGHHICYRMITAPETWTPNDKIGIYWSWDKEAADAHWGNFDSNNKKWLIKASISKDNVDWPITIVYNTLSSYQDEKEIRIIDDSKVKIISYKIVK